MNNKKVKYLLVALFSMASLYLYAQDDLYYNRNSKQSNQQKQDRRSNVKNNSTSSQTQNSKSRSGDYYYDNDNNDDDYGYDGYEDNDEYYPGKIADMLNGNNANGREYERNQSNDKESNTTVVISLGTSWSPMWYGGGWIHSPNYYNPWCYNSRYNYFDPFYTYGWGYSWGCGSWDWGYRHYGWGSCYYNPYYNPYYGWNYPYYGGHYRPGHHGGYYRPIYYSNSVRNGGMVGSSGTNRGSSSRYNATLSSGRGGSSSSAIRGGSAIGTNRNVSSELRRSDRSYNRVNGNTSVSTRPTTNNNRIGTSNSGSSVFRGESTTTNRNNNSTYNRGSSTSRGGGSVVTNTGSSTRGGGSVGTNRGSSTRGGGTRR